jgi:hypothetical protein
MLEQGATGWHKSTYSGEGTTCVEQGNCPDGRVGVRDTKMSGTGPVLRFGADQWSAFLGFARQDKV